ncbi:MAG: hypothetical protein GY724_10700 [Actinomycetia bacterium]|nr:hypothetical protein [Actinomycetes bacterium]MCP5030188.1 hypothetical protein [Actinomycetes bacterium]
MDLCQLVRTSCHQIVDQADLVTIDQEQLRAYAKTLIAGLAIGPDWEQEPGSQKGPEELAAEVLTLDAINFGSGYHDIVDKEPGRSGATTMAIRWKRYLDGHELSPGRLGALTMGDCATIFGQDPDIADQAELMELFATALRDLGSFVSNRFGGSYLSVVQEADGSARRLASSLLTMPLYQDRSPGPPEAHFYKRAQITAADLSRAFANQAPSHFDDLDRLTAFADNLVPHVLRVDGILRYDPDLATTIDSGQRLEAGSRAEIEIRAAGVEAVERLVAELARLGRLTRAMDVDLALWSRGGGPRYKAIPRHRTRCAYY